MFMSLLVIERFDSVEAFSKLSDRIGSAVTSCNSFFNQLALISTSCNTDNRYAVSKGSGYAVLIYWDEYAVLDKELDTPYPMEVDTLYSTVDQNSVWKSVGYGVSMSWIRLIGLYSSVVLGKCKHGYAVSFLMDMAYWSSE
ncbi:hypothetical protein Tco_0257604 [Tanacetum coccineum]